MSQTNKDHVADEPQDDPLSPEAQAMMDRVRRRAAISMMLMLLGFMAIVVVVVYRLATMGTTPADGYALEALFLPEGAQIVSTQLSDGLVSITYQVGEQTAIRLFDGEDGTLLREIAIENAVAQ